MSSVFTEQSQICVMNTESAKQERGDLCWQNNLTHCLSQQVCWSKHLHFWLMILRKKICCKSTKNEWTKIAWLSFVLDAGFLKNSWSRTVFHDKRHWRILTIYRISGMSWVHLAKRRRFIWTKRLHQREHQNWARIGSFNLLLTRKIWGGNQNSVCEQRPFSEFLMDWISWSRTWATQRTTTSRKLLRWSSKNLRDWMQVILQADQRKTTKTRFCQLIHKNFTHWWGEFGLMLNQESIRSTIIQCRRNWSSSSWKSTSRQWWNDWILENNWSSYGHFLFYHHWSDEKWKSRMAGGGGNKKRYQYCADSSGAFLYLRALQSHSGRNRIDPSLQDKVVILDGFFKYVYHVGCATFHHQFRIDSWRTKFEQQTDSIFLLVDPMDKEHKDLDTIDLGAPRLAQ